MRIERGGRGGLDASDPFWLISSEEDSRKKKKGGKRKRDELEGEKDHNPL